MLGRYALPDDAKRNKHKEKLTELRAAGASRPPVKLDIFVAFLICRWTGADREKSECLLEKIITPVILPDNVFVIFR